MAIWWCSTPFMTRTSRPRPAPGVYDIHSPRIPGEQEIEDRIYEILKKMDIEKVWINPDCGLKTRGNAETWPSLEHMVAAAKAVRAKITK